MAVEGYNLDECLEFQDILETLRSASDGFVAIKNAARFAINTTDLSTASINVFDAEQHALSQAGKPYLVAELGNPDSTYTPVSLTLLVNDGQLISPRSKRVVMSTSRYSIINPQLVLGAYDVKASPRNLFAAVQTFSPVEEIPVDAKPPLTPEAFGKYIVDHADEIAAMLSPTRESSRLRHELNQVDTNRAMTAADLVAIRSIVEQVVDLD